jgi:hypothetical protein
MRLRWQRFDARQQLPHDLLCFLGQYNNEQKQTERQHFDGTLPKSCLGRAFNFKMVCFALPQHKSRAYKRSTIELKTWSIF